MRARHAHTKGQPRRSWAPLDPDAPRTALVLVDEAPFLSPKQRADLLDQMDGDLFREVRRGPMPLGTAKRTTDEILEHLAPRHTPAKAVARGARRLVGLGLYAVCVLLAAAVAPVVYEVQL